MANRIQVSAPQQDEELRQIAEAISDIHYVMGIIVENAPQLVAGEAVEELKQAWTESEQSMASLVNNLDPHPPVPESPRSQIKHETLVKGELVGPVGKIKKSWLGRLKDLFLKFWNSEPHTEDKKTQAANAACDYLELGSTVVSSIPGHEQVVELLSLTKQLIGVRVRRGV